MPLAPVARGHAAAGSSRMPARASAATHRVVARPPPSRRDAPGRCRPRSASGGRLGRFAGGQEERAARAVAHDRGARARPASRQVRAAEREALEERVVLHVHQRRRGGAGAERRA